VRKANFVERCWYKSHAQRDVDLYVEYTGTALTAVLGENPQGDSNAVYQRVKQEYAQRFGLEVTEPWDLRIRLPWWCAGRCTQSASRDNVRHRAAGAALRAGVGYEFLERPDGYRGWTNAMD